MAAYITGMTIKNLRESKGIISGDAVINKNISSNVLRSKFYVCPICGNIIRTLGETVISCCGIVLPYI